MGTVLRILAVVAVLGGAGGALAQQSPCATPGGAGVSATQCVGSGLKPGAQGIEINKNWSLDAGSAGGRLLASGTAAAASGPLALGGYNGLERSYTSAQLNGAYWIGRSQFATRVSLLQGEEKLNAYGLGAGFAPDFRNRLSQVAATARYGYWFDGFMPYASLTLASGAGPDRAANPAYGLRRDVLVPKVGIDFYAGRGLTGGIAYSLEQGAGTSAPKNEVWSANMSFRF